MFRPQPEIIDFSWYLDCLELNFDIQPKRGYGWIVRVKEEPKQLVFEEGDVVMYYRNIGVLKYNTGGGHKWKIILNGNENGFYFVDDRDIRHLTEKEWVHDLFPYKVYLDQNNDYCFVGEDRSIFSNEFQKVLSFTFISEMMKELNIRVMPYKQWKRMKEERDEKGKG